MNLVSEPGRGRGASGRTCGQLGCGRLASWWVDTWILSWVKIQSILNTSFLQEHGFSQALGTCRDAGRTLAQSLGPCPPGQTFSGPVVASVQGQGVGLGPAGLGASDLSCQPHAVCGLTKDVPVCGCVFRKNLQQSVKSFKHT